MWGFVGWGIVLFLVGVLVILSYYCFNFFIKLFEVNYIFCFYIFGVLMFLVFFIFIRFKFIYGLEDIKEVKDVGIIDSFK